MKMRRGSSLLQDLIAIAIILAALYLVFPSWFSWLPFGQSSVNAQVIITYEDGTSKTYDTKFGRVNLAVAQAGSQVAITNIAFIVKATPTWSTGSVTTISGVTWAISGRIDVDGVYKQAVTGEGPASITNGVAATVSTTNLSGSTLNTWIPFDGKSHPLHYTCTVEATFTPPNESAKTISGNVMGDLSLQNIGFPALLTLNLSTTVT